MSSKKRSGKSRKNRKFFIIALLAIVVAEVGYISAMLLPALESRPTNAQTGFNSFALMEESLINISSTQPSLVNPAPYINRTTLIYVTIPTTSGCPVPLTALNNLSARGFGVILVLMNPYGVQPILQGSQLTTSLYNIRLACGAAPSSGVLLASAYWVTPTPGQLPLGLINVTQPLVKININNLNPYMPLAIATYGNGTVKGLIYGPNALNASVIEKLVDN
ncbi:MAG: hypothetical protein ACP5NY_08635 [Thermocladium sp.]